MAQANGVKVTILLYSGRPDPTYTIKDTGTLNELVTLISAARSTQRPGPFTVIPSILGYRGVVLENPGKVAGIPTYTAAYNGNIEIEDGGKRFLVDQGRGLEHLLLRTAVEKKVIDEGVLRSAQEREPPR